MKQLKKKSLMIAGLLLCALVLGTVAQPVWAAKYTFKLGHAVSDQHPYHLGAVRFKEVVEKETNGEVEINLFPNNQLGTGERDLIEGLQLGTVDMVVSSTGPMSGFEKKFMIFDFPFRIRHRPTPLLMEKLDSTLWDSLRSRALRDWRGMKMVSDILQTQNVLSTCQQMLRA